MPELLESVLPPQEPVTAEGVFHVRVAPDEVSAANTRAVCCSEVKAPSAVKDSLVVEDQNLTFL